MDSTKLLYNVVLVSFSVVSLSSSWSTTDLSSEIMSITNFREYPSQAYWPRLGWRINQWWTLTTCKCGVVWSFAVGFHCSKRKREKQKPPHGLIHLFFLVSLAKIKPSLSPIILLPARTPAAPGDALPRGSATKGGAMLKNDTEVMMYNVHTYLG